MPCRALATLQQCRVTRCHDRLWDASMGRAISSASTGVFIALEATKDCTRCEQSHLVKQLAAPPVSGG